MCNLKAIASAKLTEIFHRRHTITVEGVFDGDSCTFESALVLLRHRRFPAEVIRKNGRNGVAERPRLVNFLARKAGEAGLCSEEESPRKLAVRLLSYTEFECAPGVLVSTAELAELMCVGKSTLSGWVQSRGMPQHVEVKNMMKLWDAAEVLSWLQSCFGQDVRLPFLSRAQVIAVLSRVSPLPIDALIRDFGMPKPLEFERSVFMRRWNYKTFVDWLERVKFD